MLKGKDVAGFSGLLLLSLAAAFLLFSGVSILHSTIGFASKNKAGKAEQHPVVINIQRKPAEKKQMIRKVRLLQARQVPVHGAANMDLRFAPDLGIGTREADDGEVALGSRDLTVEIFDEGQVDEQAHPEYTPPVSYPQEAIDRGISGTVKVVFVVTFKGTVKDVTIVASSSTIFTAAVKREVAAWRFSPAKKNGIPVNQRYQRAIEFVLD